MKLFFDTCTVIDYLCNRQNGDRIEQILIKAEKEKGEGFISVGSFYTLTYLIELNLKRQGYPDKQERIEELRNILDKILSIFSIAEINSIDLHACIKNYSFTDLEDCYQYRAALNAKCDYLITANIRDFKDADNTHIKIIEPSEFF